MHQFPKQQYTDKIIQPQLTNTLASQSSNSSIKSRFQITNNMNIHFYFHQCLQFTLVLGPGKVLADSGPVAVLC